MSKSNKIIIKDLEDHIESFGKAYDECYKYSNILFEDSIKLLESYNATKEEIQQVFSILNGDIENIRLIRYMANEDEKNIKDIIRQAYVIENDPIPYERKPQNQKCTFTKEEIQMLEDLNIPYSVKEIEKESKQDNLEHVFEMILADTTYLEKLVKKTKNAQTRKLLKRFEDEFMPEVPNKDVKEIHVYFDDFDEELLFLDQEGLHKVVGKKARVEFLNGKRKVGYVGSDFVDDDGDECVSLFEAFDTYKGFYDYHTYKIKDILKMDVLCYPRKEIDFGFEIKVRHINKYVKGVTERKK